MQIKRMVWALALVGIGACASSGGQANKVSDADVGRLAADEMGPLDEARDFATKAKDERNRAELALERANHEVGLAKADTAAAQAAAEQAKAQRAIADDNREAGAMRQARTLEEQATLHQQAADARKEFADKLVGARKSSLQAADKKVDLANAKLELAKVQALRQANVAAGTKYDTAAFQARVNEAQRAHDEAVKNAHESQAEAATARTRWEDADRTLQARVSGETTEEGMGSKP